MNANPTILPVRLANGVVIQAEVSGSAHAREGDVAADQSFAPRSLDDVIAAIEGIAASVGDAFARVRPDEASVEFGLELAAESGKLTALLVKGGGKASLSITLKWIASSSPDDIAPVTGEGVQDPSAVTETGL